MLQALGGHIGIVRSGQPCTVSGRVLTSRGHELPMRFHGLRFGVNVLRPVVADLVDLRHEVSAHVEQLCEVDRRNRGHALHGRLIVLQEYDRRIARLRAHERFYSGGEQPDLVIILHRPAPFALARRFPTRPARTNSRRQPTANSPRRTRTCRLTGRAPPTSWAPTRRTWRTSSQALGRGSEPTPGSSAGMTPARRSRRHTSSPARERSLARDRSLETIAPPGAPAPTRPGSADWTPGRSPHLLRYAGQRLEHLPRLDQRLGGNAG